VLTFLPERGFTDWLFAEAARGAPETELGPQSQTQPTDSQPSVPAASVREGPSDARRNPPTGPRGNAPLYQQALSQALPNPSPTAQKRTASGRSPSPSGQNPNKSRRTDLPSGPRAMRDARQSGPSGPRSLLERVGPRSAGNTFPRPDNIQNNIPGPGDIDLQAAMAAGFVPPGMNGMDMNALAAAQMGPNPLMLQEMMMNQMAMMAQMATSLGMMNPNPGQFGGFPMQPGAQDVGMYGGPGGFNGPPVGGTPNRGRAGGKGTYSERARGDAASHLSITESLSSEGQPPPALQLVEAPAPTSTPTVAPTPATPQPTRPNFAVPERPQSPTLCKFSLKCTNPHCRWSHPSPVATPESGMVLSNEPCEQGKDCKDKDCIKAHISPAAVNPALGMLLTFQLLPDPDFHVAEHKPSTPATPSTPAPPSHSNVFCRYGATCTRRDCAFQHPASRKPSSSRPPQAQATPCRFGAACTRTTCPFQHPEGRVLPSTFHRGLSSTTPIVSVPAPQTGTMGTASPHKTVVFNKPSQSKALGTKAQEIENERSRTIQAVKEAEEAAAKKDNSKRTPIAA
jgi:nuclear polyadenylated RNA-binding protein NAB2